MEFLGVQDLKTNLMEATCNPEDDGLCCPVGPKGQEFYNCTSEGKL